MCSAADTEKPLRNSFPTEIKIYQLSEQEDFIQSVLLLAAVNTKQDVYLWVLPTHRNLIYAPYLDSGTEK